MFLFVFYPSHGRIRVCKIRFVRTGENRRKSCLVCKTKRAPLQVVSHLAEQRTIYHLCWALRGFCCIFMLQVFYFCYDNLWRMSLYYYKILFFNIPFHTFLFFPLILEVEIVFLRTRNLPHCHSLKGKGNPIIRATSWENLFLPYANNKGADQPAHPRSLISAFVVCSLDSIISILAIAKISRL